MRVGRESTHVLRHSWGCRVSRPVQRSLDLACRLANALQLVRRSSHPAGRDMRARASCRASRFDQDRRPRALVEEAKHGRELAAAYHSRPEHECVVRRPCRGLQLIEIVSGLVGEAANLAVTQSVEREGENVSRDGDWPDLAAAACGDPAGRGGCGAYRRLTAAVRLREA